MRFIILAFLLALITSSFVPVINAAAPVFSGSVEDIAETGVTEEPTEEDAIAECGILFAEFPTIPLSFDDCVEMFLDGTLEAWVQAWINSQGGPGGTLDCTPDPPPPECLAECPPEDPNCANAGQNAYESSVWQSGYDPEQIAPNDCGPIDPGQIDGILGLLPDTLIAPDDFKIKIKVKKFKIKISSHVKCKMWRIKEQTQANMDNMCDVMSEMSEETIGTNPDKTDKAQQAVDDVVDGVNSIETSLMNIQNLATSNMTEAEFNDAVNQELDIIDQENQEMQETMQEMTGKKVDQWEVSKSGIDPTVAYKCWDGPPFVPEPIQPKDPPPGCDPSWPAGACPAGCLDTNVNTICPPGCEDTSPATQCVPGCEDTNPFTPCPPP